MLTSEEVREIETIMDDPARRWKMSPGEAITYIEALLEDRAEMQAEIERLQGVNQTYRILVEELREEIERLRAEYAQTLTAIATAISLTADIPNETAAALCRMCNRNLAALEGEE